MDDTLPASRLMRLGDARMDREHEEFAALLQALADADDAAFVRCFDAFRAHATAHFAHEDAQMREHDFDSRACHLDEHAAVLASMAQVKERLDAGQLEVGRRFVREVQRWLPEHIEALDTGLAKFLFRRSTGGASVQWLRHAPRGGAAGVPA